MIGESHKLYEINGKKSQAVAQLTPWKGMGQQLTPGASIEQWGEEAVLNWELHKAPVTFQRDVEGGLELDGVYPGKQVLYRSDNGMPLSIVSDRYKDVQPMEILNFFRKWTEAGEMTLETAGSIDNGRKIWALARIGEDFSVDGTNGDGKDIVKSYTLLASSCDHTIPTIGHLTSIRDACSNSLRLIARGKKGFVVKVPHNTVFDPEKVKAEMGLAKQAIAENANTMRKMHKLALTDEQAMSFFIELLKTPEERKTGKVDVDKKRRAIPRIWTSYKAAPGAEDTVWGAVNAVTHSVDFNPHSRTDSNRLDSAWFGAGAAQKDKAYAMAADDSFLNQIADHTATTQTALDRVLSVVDI